MSHVNVQRWGGIFSPELLRNTPYRTCDSLYSQGEGIWRTAYQLLCALAQTHNSLAIISHMAPPNCKATKKYEKADRIFGDTFCICHRNLMKFLCDLVTKVLSIALSRWTTWNSERTCNLFKVTQVIESEYNLVLCDNKTYVLFTVLYSFFPTHRVF